MYHKPKDNPCYKCEERYMGCHGSCEKYRGFKSMMQKEKDTEERGRRKAYPDKIRVRRRK